MKLTISETGRKGIIRIQLEFEGPVELLQSISCGVDKPLDIDLTKREQEVMGLLIQGYSNNQIANNLFISPHTVKNHIHNILQKYQVKSRSQLYKILSPFKLTL